MAAPQCRVFVGISPSPRLGVVQHPFDRARAAAKRFRPWTARLASALSKRHQSKYRQPTWREAGTHTVQASCAIAPDALSFRHCPSIEARNISAQSPKDGTASFFRSANWIAPLSNGLSTFDCQRPRLSELYCRIGSQAHFIALAVLFPDERPRTSPPMISRSDKARHHRQAFLALCAALHSVSVSLFVARAIERP
jgi:hypothetical protein